MSSQSANIKLMNAIEGRAILPDFETIDRRLKSVFGTPRKNCPEPVSELIRGILSQNTTDRNRDRAFENLREKFGEWQNLLTADETQIAEAISVAGMANQRAKRIKLLLREFSTVDPLKILKMKPDDAFRFLCDMEGIGPKTAAVFLLFCGNMPFFPVDTHIRRIMVRLGVFPRSTSAEKMIAVLSRTIPHRLHLTLHLNLIELGRKICTARFAMCDKCPISDLCKRILS